MAATDPRFLRKRAMAAAASLLGATSSGQALFAEPAPSSGDVWSMDTSFTRYAEGERISVIEPQVGVQRNFSENRSLNVLVTVDTITGSTPLGTLPATVNTAPNTVTTASARNPVIGKIPLSKMTDTRYGVNTTWQQPLGLDYTGAVGADVSKETDYLSLGANTNVSRDFNAKNTTVSFGLSPEFDVSSPNGGLPVGYGTLYAPGSIDGTRDTKWLVSGLAGVTQVINRRMLMQFNYGFTHENGYLSDPYKLLSLVNAAGDPLSAIYEKRPGKRTEHNFYWLTKYNIWAKDVFSLGLRFYTDDWGIRSQTLDFTFRRQSSEQFFWEPHVRYYHQSAADFYHVGLLDTQALPTYASPDLRLAEFDGVTFGVRFGYTLKNGSLLVVRGEYYTQSGESHPKDAVGAQKSFDLFPSLYATILQVDYTFDPTRLWSKKK